MNAAVECVRCHTPFTVFSVVDGERSRYLKCSSCGTEFLHKFQGDELYPTGDVAEEPEVPGIVKLVLEEQAKRR